MNEARIYVVLKGRTPGIYISWTECKKQVEGYPDAVYRGFNDGALALLYARTGETPPRQLTFDMIEK